MSGTHLVVVPSAPVLLPAYAGLVDPVSDLRAACADAVAWLVAQHPSQLVVLGAQPRPDNVARGVTAPLSMRVARELLADFDGAVEEARQPGPVPSLDGVGVLVVADGSARRGQKAPGHIDERAFAFDDIVERALRTGDLDALRTLDADLGDDLLAGGVRTLQATASALTGSFTSEVTYADDPYGVQYWVARWSPCAS